MDYDYFVAVLPLLYQAVEQLFASNNEYKHDLMESLEYEYESFKLGGNSEVIQPYRLKAKEVIKQYIGIRADTYYPD